jgi:hypothetical protein
MATTARRAAALPPPPLLLLLLLLLLLPIALPRSAQRAALSDVVIRGATRL